MFRQVGGVPLTRYPSRGCSWRRSAGWFASVDAPFQARENVGIVAARGRMLSSVRPLMRQEDSRRPVWEFADWVQITHSVLEAQWKLGAVSKRGERTIRRLLIIGASAVVQQASRRGAPKGSWLAQMLARKPKMLVTVALANKMARIVWALLVKGGTYKTPAAAA